MTQENEHEPEDISPEEQAYLSALERNVASGKPLARNRPDSKKARGAAVAGASQSSSASRQRVDAVAQYSAGAILALDDGSVGIFKDAVAGKEYQLGNLDSLERLNDASGNSPHPTI